MQLLSILLATWGAWFLRGIVLWAAPVTTVRTTPVGSPMGDGFPTKIACALDANVSFWEKSVQPPGIDGGDPIPTSTMFNTAWHTMAPRVLKKMTDASIKAAYEPSSFTAILAIINVQTSWTVTWPNGDYLNFWGYLRSFEPDALDEAKQPECTIKIIATNWDPNNGVEAPPVLISSGT